MERIYCQCAEALFSHPDVKISLDRVGTSFIHRLNGSVKINYCPVCGKKLPYWDLFVRKTNSTTELPEVEG
jgi:hypothetical protein